MVPGHETGLSPNCAVCMRNGAMTSATSPVHFLVSWDVETRVLRSHVKPIARVSRGIPHGVQATGKLFLAKTLVSTSDFPHVSQKILKGAASRFVIFWMMSVAAQKLAENPGDEMAAIRHGLFSALAALLTVFASNPCPGIIYI